VKSKKRSKRYILYKILLVLSIFFILFIGSGCSTPSVSAINVLNQSNKQSCPIIGNVEKAATLTQLDKTNPLLAQTFVAVEDKRFYDHHGIDVHALGRAIFKDVSTLSKTEGGSTITMQVARNEIMHNAEKTWKRKLTEMLIAWNLENQCDKNEILQSYLNHIYFGESAYGIRQAAITYFGIDPVKGKLTPYQIALLAGLPRGPNYYDPYLDPHAAKLRRNTVLSLMAEQHLITQSEAHAYEKLPLGVIPHHQA
jgi:penicillin-binding protein 2A